LTSRHRVKHIQDFVATPRDGRIRMNSEHQQEAHSLGKGGGRVFNPLRHHQVFLKIRALIGLAVGAFSKCRNTVARFVRQISSKLRENPAAWLTAPHTQCA
jgi:hypothetical protein